MGAFPNIKILKQGFTSSIDIPFEVAILPQPIDVSLIFIIAFRYRMYLML